MSIVVAVKGDIKAHADGAPPPPPCSSGSWTAGAVTETLGGSISVDGSTNLVVLEAVCTFTWAGAPPPIGCKVADVSVITLKPGGGADPGGATPHATSLTDGGTDIIRDGDKYTDIHGNYLEAEVTQTKLKCA